MLRPSLLVSIDDFPDDIYILLDAEFRAEFFKTAWTLVGGYRKLAKQMGVSKPTMLCWRRGVDCDPKVVKYCPIWAIREISSLLLEKGCEKYTLNEVQKHIISYRARAGTLIVYEPKLPIEDSVELREFVVHLLCDGTAQNIPKRTCHFTSTCKATVLEVKNQLELFGKIPALRIAKCKKHSRNKQAYRLSFPKSIAKILINKFGKFEWNMGRIPEQFFQGNRKLRAAVVRAFLIDEGSIRDTRLFFTSGNRSLLCDLREICEALGYRCGKLRKTRTAYELSICSESFKQVYEDMMRLGKLPIEYKQRRFETGCKLLTSKYDFSILKEQIVKLLAEKPLSAVAISDTLCVRARSAWYHLKQLERSNIAKVCEISGKGGTHKWTLTSFPNSL